MTQVNFRLSMRSLAAWFILFVRLFVDKLTLKTASIKISRREQKLRKRHLSFC